MIALYQMQPFSSYCSLFFLLFTTDRPDPPSGLTLLPVEPLTLSWTPPFTPSASPGVILSYFVNVTNVNTSSVFSYDELRTPNFKFNGTEASSPCDVYQFTVTARNEAGWSEPSATFTASLPSCKLLEQQYPTHTN